MDREGEKDYKTTPGVGHCEKQGTVVDFSSRK